MKDERLLNREVEPGPDLVTKVIGREVTPVWEDVNHHLLTHYAEFEPEWIFYNPQHGWGLRFRKESQQLCMLFPEWRGFTAFLTLTPEEDMAALEKIHYFNARIRDLLNQPSALPQGRWLWMRLEDHTDFVGLKLLLEIKTTL